MNSLTVLRDFCLELICSNSEILFESPKFLMIDKSLLNLFIQRDDLNIGECEIWEYILKWGTSQLLGVNELSNWTKEYLIELEEIFHDIIPLIRWFHIPSKLFHEKIRPYKMIFLESLYDDIVGYYIDPNLPPKPKILLEPRKSAFKITNRKHFAIVSSWIDGKSSNHYNIRNTPHSFELLYKASRDGFDSTRFDELCEEGSTLMIAKIKNTGRLIGGYWKSKNNFLFSFENQDDVFLLYLAIIGELISTKLKDPRFTQDPSFGNNNMSDLTINNKEHTIECNSTHSFPEIKSFINVRQKFLLEDYEVYKVTKASKLTRDSIIVIFIPIVKFILQGCANILVNVSQKDKINSIVNTIIINPETKWEPNNIPCSKPFIHIVTSPSGPLVTQDDMNFVKTKSLIYSIFHPKARYVNFEVGYSKDAKWLSFLDDKWSEYVNFFIGGFVEAVYSVKEKGSKVLYIQINAKSIDFDIRFRTSTISTSASSSFSSPKSPANAFALRRNQILNSSPKDSFPVENEQEENNNELNEDMGPIVINDDTVDAQISTPIPKTKKRRQLSDLCDELDQAVINEPDDDESVKPKRKEYGRGRMWTWKWRK